MQRLDSVLAELAKQPVPQRLESLEAHVWQGVAAAQPAWGLGMQATALAAAMLVGVMSGLLSGAPIGVADMDALSVRPALLPSTLLAAS